MARVARDAKEFLAILREFAHEPSLKYRVERKRGGSLEVTTEGQARQP
jgi:hypothetical protein